MKDNNVQSSKKEKGQALVIIALAFVAIMGFAALAVDLGRVMSTRRSAQVAADAAALSAAYSRCMGEDPYSSAYKVAALNGFTDTGYDDSPAKLYINIPPIEGPYTDDGDYIEVMITTTDEPIFSSFVYNGPLESTVRAVGHCVIGSTGTASGPGLGNGVAILALNPTAKKAFTNVGGAQIIVDGGVYVNSTASDAVHQTGSATLKMSWAKVRGGADVGGAFGTYLDGSGGIAKQIDVVGDFRTSGAGQSIAGAFNIGGSVINTASINMTGNPLNVGGSFDNSGAGTVVASQLLIGGDIKNTGSGSFTSDTMLVGGSISANGGSWFRPTSGHTLDLRVNGDIDLSGSAMIGQNNNASVLLGGKVKTSGGAKVNGTATKASLPKPTFSVTVPQLADPLADVLFPPAPPTESCTKLSIQNWGGPHKPAMVSGKYYCNIDVGGSASVIIPPGTYWTDSFSLGGAASLVMDGVHLYITGKKANNAFTVGGSGSVSLMGTMVYIQSGSFSFNGAGGTLNWTAPGAGQEYQGLALYMDRANSSAADLTGSAKIGQMSGTWYAPASACSFVGATKTTVYSQFICDTVKVTGSANLTIKYDSTLVYQVSTPGQASEVSLAE